ncbi:saccharopine dehydrogenase NADP-binding domain-containing protein [Streptomyces sp. NBC_01727]|uniref:saccharopine dehydrogenase NADP-binding domain-containing protein n=1 Tax=Streptomyces sp. NBC_01727 TaxID=2975924 RepID=UPI002E125708|nr:saccharopine dehydrogenase NADP-binding domain-containing protein [Streptomyces sp. NBC_01727]
MNTRTSSDDPIAVYGATGHTGRLVAAALAARGHSLVLGGRDTTALTTLADQLPTSAQVVTAPLENPQKLRQLTGAAQVLINCAGPFSHTGAPVAAAAVAQGCHYLGHAAEPLHIKQMYDTFAGADVVVIPGMSFYGGIADLLAAAVTNGMTAIDEVEVAYAVTGWRMTAASKAAAAELIQADTLTYQDGQLHIAPAQQRTGTFTYPLPLGHQPVIQDYPGGEVVTIPRHVPTRSVRVAMTSSTFAEEAVFTSEDVSPAERAQSAFTVAVRAQSPAQTRTAWLQGRDIYTTGAIASVEAAARLTQGQHPPVTGALSPAQVFAPADILTALPAVELHGVRGIEATSSAP